MSPVLGYPMPDLGYRLYTDASNHGIGAVLQQVQPIKIRDLQGTKIYTRLKNTFDNRKPIPSLVTQIKEEQSHIPTSLTWAKEFGDTEIWIKRVICYWSRLFKQAEKNYTVTEKEALALKEALVKFLLIIQGEQIITITDHSALTWSCTYQSVNRRLTTYGTTFAGFEEKLKIIHRARKFTLMWIHYQDYNREYPSTMLHITAMTCRSSSTPHKYWISRRNTTTRSNQWPIESSLQIQGTN